MLTFIEETHSYFLDGTPIPGVHEIMQDLKLIDTSWFSEEGAENGKRRHKITEDIDRGEFDWSTIREDDIYAAQGWNEFLADYRPEIQEIEKAMYHELFGYAGTVDRLAILEGKPSVIDIKTGQMTDWYDIQMMLYGAMCLYNDEEGTHRPNLYIVHIREAKKKNYRLIPVSWDRWEIAKSITAVYNFKHRRF